MKKTTLLILLLGSTAFATSPKLDANYFTVGEVSVRQLSDESVSEPQALQNFSTTFLSSQTLGSQCNEKDLQLFNQRLLNTPTDVMSEITGDLDIAEVVLDKVINMGKKVWDIVAAGKPVVSNKSAVATALPQGSGCWLNLENWQAPRSSAWQITYKNLYGIKVVDFTYQIVYVYGGSVRGAGKYIGYATIQPMKLDVAWGYTFNSEVRVPTVYNMGSKENPVAGMNLNVKWSVDTILNHSEQTDSYFISGLGELKSLN